MSLNLGNSNDTHTTKSTISTLIGVDWTYFV